MVWNELKSYADVPGVGGDMWTYPQRFVEFYLNVSIAVKAVNPNARIGGPYAPMSRGQYGPERIASGECTMETTVDWGCINPAMLEFMQYFAEHARGHYDFVVFDARVRPSVTVPWDTMVRCTTPH